MAFLGVKIFIKIFTFVKILKIFSHDWCQYDVFIRSKWKSDLSDETKQDFFPVMSVSVLL